MYFPHIQRVGFTPMKFDVPKDPLAVSLFGAIGIMMVTQHLAHLIHQFQFRIGDKLLNAIIFHATYKLTGIHGKYNVPFSMFYH